MRFGRVPVAGRTTEFSSCSRGVGSGGQMIRVRMSQLRTLDHRKNFLLVSMATSQDF